ncbi:hypothetical protein CRE_15628 [Caenorhabditis remanei]|uniref:F-box domain-containing protein n=1 Tax=Caenorhabditis remanei TaxID=31234 RepID=E3N2Q8_CAERE|nr:hypothetical protein CRE_15628 [Caenorhabditis remanei]
MSSINPFSLLRLPFIPLQNVIRMLNPHEVLKFAMISQKSKKIAKIFTIKKSCYMSIWFDTFPEFDISFTKHTYRTGRNYTQKYIRRSDLWRFGSTSESETVRYKQPEWQYLGIKSENPIATCLRMVEYIQEIYDTTLYCLVFFEKRFNTNDLKTIITWMNTRDSLHPISTFYVELKNRYSLDLVVNTLQASIDCFRPFLDDSTSMNSLKFPQTFKNTKYFTDHAPDCQKWVTVETLLTMNPERVYVEFSHLTDQDINKFLRNWMAGKSNFNMNRYNLGINKKMDWRQVLRGLKATIWHPETRKISYQINEDDTVTLHGGVDIERIDGKIATIEILCYHNHSSRRIRDDAIEEYEEAFRSWNEDKRDLESLEFRRGNDKGGEIAENEEEEEEEIGRYGYSLYRFSIHVW